MGIISNNLHRTKELFSMSMPVWIFYLRKIAILQKRGGTNFKNFTLTLTTREAGCGQPRQKQHSVVSGSRTVRAVFSSIKYKYWLRLHVCIIHLSNVHLFYNVLRMENVVLLMHHPESTPCQVDGRSERSSLPSNTSIDSDYMYHSS